MLMSDILGMEEMIADSMTTIMDRSNKLNRKDQLSIGQEFREWLQEGCILDELLIFTPFC